MSGEATVRVVVADDSPTARALLVATLAADPRLCVVGEAADGREAVRQIRRLRPSIAVLDVHMPGIDGLEATKQVMRELPTPIVIVTGSLAPHDVEVGLHAMRAGALTVLPKLPAPAAPEFPAAASRLVSTVAALAGVDRRRPIAARERPRPRQPQGVRCVAVAASTGGPAALYRLLENLPASLGVPLLVAQHLSEGFVPGLVAWLGSGTALSVATAADGELLRPATVYLAPDGHDLAVGPGGRTLLAPRAAGSLAGASADTLFTAVARWYGPSAVAVVLTGMGTDGLLGAAKIKEAGGRVLAQDRASSVVFGMPGAVATAGLTDRVGPVDALARTICALVQGAAG